MNGGDPKATTKARVLLTEAARLIETALVKLNTTTTECPVCARALWASSDEGKIYEQFSDTPVKLRRAAERLRELQALAERPATHGYAKAVDARQAREKERHGEADTQ